jgi:hypothetical protein
MILFVTFEDPKEREIEEWKDLLDMCCKYYKFILGRTKKIQYIINQITWTIIHQ